MSKDPIVCFCNNVAETKVTAAIAAGADDLDKIYDSTGAGVGPCGGTCRRVLNRLLCKSQDVASAALQKPVAPRPIRKADSWSPSIEFIEAVSLFNRRYFWEAHEALEKIWLEENGKIRVLYQAIIQASACFYHVLGANPKGALRLAVEAQNKIKAYLPSYEGVQLRPLYDSLENFHVQSRQILSGTLGGFRFEELPLIDVSDQD